MSPSSLSAVTIKIMMPLVAGSLLSFLQTSKPLSLGIMISSRIRCGWNYRPCERILPVDRHCRFDVQPGEIRLEQLDVRLVVVGDEDAAFFLVALFCNHLPQSTQRSQRIQSMQTESQQCIVTQIILLHLILCDSVSSVVILERRGWDRELFAQLR